MGAYSQTRWLLIGLLVISVSLSGISIAEQRARSSTYVEPGECGYTQVRYRPVWSLPRWSGSDSSLTGFYREADANATPYEDRNFKERVIRGMRILNAAYEKRIDTTEITDEQAPLAYAKSIGPDDLLLCASYRFSAVPDFVLLKYRLPDTVYAEVVGAVSVGWFKSQQHMYVLPALDIYGQQSTFNQMFRENPGLAKGGSLLASLLFLSCYNDPFPFAVIEEKEDLTSAVRLRRLLEPPYILGPSSPTADALYFCHPSANVNLMSQLNKIVLMPEETHAIRSILKDFDGEFVPCAAVSRGDTTYVSLLELRYATGELVRWLFGFSGDGLEILSANRRSIVTTKFGANFWY